MGENGGTFLRVEVDSICKEVLALFLQMHARDYYPLPDDRDTAQVCPRLA